MGISSKTGESEITRANFPFNYDLRVLSSGIPVSAFPKASKVS